jgi:hypothetical protein
MSRKRAAVYLGCLVLFLAVGLSRAQKTAPAASMQDFEVRGVGFTQCQCTAYACPCRSNGHPTHGGCDAADFAYIQRGHYGTVKLDGLKAVAIGDLIDVKQERTGAIVYFDQKSTPAQREAFLAMFQSMFQWNPAKISQTKVVPIEFHESADKTTYRVNIPGILEEKAVMKRDGSGKPVNTVPAMDQWGNAIHYVDNVVFKYHDKDAGKEWDLSGRQANVKYFHTTKKMYDNKELLVQHGDMSGTWTAKQKELIHKAGMKIE